MQQPITKQQIKKLQEQNKPVRLIDIRPPEEFEKMQVPGSVNVPAETLPVNTTNFTPNDIIVCICTKGLERSQNAADVIAAMGFSNVCYLKEGVVGWLAE